MDPLMMNSPTGYEVLPWQVISYLTGLRKEWLKATNMVKKEEEKRREKKERKACHWREGTSGFVTKMTACLPTSFAFMCGFFWRSDIIVNANAWLLQWFL
jgi:hypothetical protein